MGLDSLDRSADRRRLRLARIVAGSWCRSVRCGRKNGQSIVHPQRAIATRACLRPFLGTSHRAFILQQRNGDGAAYVPSINFYTACDLGMDHLQHTVWYCMTLDSPQGSVPLPRPCQKYTFSYLIHLDDHSPNTFSLHWRSRRAGSS